MVTVPLYITITCSTTRILMSQITFEKFLQLASSQSVQCQISTFFVWLEPRVLRLWEQWMEHKVEQNLNKTSATDLRGSEPDPEWFGFFSLLPKSLRGEFPLSAQQIRERIFWQQMLLFLLFVDLDWRRVSIEHEGGIKLQSHFFPISWFNYR